MFFFILNRTYIFGDTIVCVGIEYKLTDLFNQPQQRDSSLLNRSLPPAHKIIIVKGKKNEQ